MKKFAVIAVVLTLFATSFTVAQDFKAVNKAGSKALLFKLEGLGFLGAENFNGGIGFKLMTSNNFAIRGGLSFLMYNETLPYTGGGTGTDGSASIFGIGTEVAALYYISQGERLFPYIGLGAGFGTFSTEQKDPYLPPADQPIWKNYDVDGYVGSTQFGVALLAGFEFFLWEELSIGAEYQLGLRIQSLADRTYTLGAVSTTTKLGSSTLVSIQSTVQFTLGLHFN